MTELRGYASVTDFGRHARVQIGRDRLSDFDARITDVVTRIDENGTVLRTVESQEGMSVEGGLLIDIEVAEVLYHALDRMFGSVKKPNDDLREALTIERSRVDSVLNLMTGH